MTPSSPITPDAIRDELSRLTTPVLVEGLKLLFAAVERGLFDEAAETEDEAVRSSIFEDIATTREEKSSLLRAFNQHLVHPEAGTQKADWHELIGDRQTAVSFEDGLGEARRRCGTEHALYEARVEALHEQAPHTFPARFYTLDAVSRAFFASIGDFPDSLRLRLVTHWPEQVLDLLVPHYATLNDFLARAGILPGLKRWDDAAPGAEPPVVERPTARTASPISTPVSRSGPDEEDLPELLEPLARATLEGDDQYLFRFERDEDWLAEDFAAFMMERIEPGAHPSVWPADSRELLRLVGMTFSDLLNDHMIEARHRRLISQLQVAVLLAASRDRHFLSDADHPMRRILNLIALIGSDPGVNQDPRPTADLIPEIQRAVLDDEDRLTMMVDRLHEQSRGRQQAGAQPAATLAQERLAEIEQRCRDRVALMIDEQSDGLPITEGTRAALDQLFAPFMVRTMLRQGRQVTLWTRIIEVLREAITLQMDPTLGNDDVETFGAHARDLFESAQSDGLQAEERRALEAFLAHLHELAEQSMVMPEPVKAPTPHTQEPPAETGAPASPPTQEQTPAETDEEETADQPASTETPSASGEESEKPLDGLILASLPFVRTFFEQQGKSEEWFEVHTGPGRALRRLKIRNLDADHGVINFANRTGQSRLTLPVAQVIDDLLEGRTRMVFETPRFSQSLDRLRGQLEEYRHDEERAG